MSDLVHAFLFFTWHTCIYAVAAIT